VTSPNQNNNIINQYLKGSFNVDGVNNHETENIAHDDFIHEDTSLKKTVGYKTRIRSIYPYALMLILLGSLPLFWSMFASGDKNDERLYAEYFTPYENIFIQRGGMNERPAELEKAIKSYDAANYSDAMENFRMYMQNETASDAVILYYSISCMESGELSEAIARLESLSANTESLFCEQAQWFLSLAYLKNKNREKASRMLQSIVLNNSYQQEKAVELIDKL
jgi:hypothetical protein